MECYNELTIIVCLLMTIFFTDALPDPKAKEAMANIMIAVIVIHIIVNWVYFIVTTVHKVVRFFKDMKKNAPEAKKQEREAQMDATIKKMEVYIKKRVEIADFEIGRKKPA